MLSALDCYNYFLDDKSVYCSNKTMIFYQENVKKMIDCLADFYGASPSSISIDYLNDDFLKKYVLFLRNSNLSSQSVKTYYCAVKVFCGWLYDHNFINQDYSKLVATPKVYSSNKLPLTVTEVSLIDSFFDCGIEKGLRNYLIFHFLLDCGLRRGEVVSLKHSDFCSETNTIRVIGKGNKIRYVPVPEPLRYELTLYYNFYCLNYDDDYVFHNLDGSPITSNTIKMMFQRLKDDTGINRITPHLLRHTFATSYVMSGGNIEFLRLLLGHSDITTTQVYVHLSNNCRVLNVDVYRLDDVFFNFMKF